MTVETAPAFRASYETQQLVARLRQLVESEDYSVVPYAELAAIAGGDVQHDAKAKGYLRTARNTCERETGRLFGVVANVGVKLLAPGQEQAGFANDQLSRTKRMTRRSRTRLSRIQFEKLNENDKKMALLSLTFISTVAAFSTPSRLKRLEEQVGKMGAALPLNETLALFGPKK